MINNACLKFQGFTPSEFTFSFLNKKLNAISEEAPYDSHLSAVFARKGLTFEGQIQVNATAGKFAATASGQNIKEMTYRLVEQIQNQIDKWKTQRFVSTNVVA
ncbi:MAG: hypothetical protein AABZ31_10840 [Bdellovibrionota bacterium]